MKIEECMNEWQKCPVCDGQGLVNKPPWIAGDQHEWSDTSCGPYTCRRCGGTGTILRPLSTQATEAGE